jgi:glucan phosphoethanolaminetransferase (alkaline phosphatase superfamily)
MFYPLELEKFFTDTVWLLIYAVTGAIFSLFIILDTSRKRWSNLKSITILIVGILAIFTAASLTWWDIYIPRRENDYWFEMEKRQRIKDEITPYAKLFSTVGFIYGTGFTSIGVWSFYKLRKLKKNDGGMTTDEQITTDRERH